jgi:hypothetical protein
MYIRKYTINFYLVFSEFFGYLPTLEVVHDNTVFDK